MARTTKEQRIQRIMRRTIGTLVLSSAILGYLHSPYWLFVTMFVGANLLQFGFTDWCLLQEILKKIVKE